MSATAASVLVGDQIRTPGDLDARASIAEILGYERVWLTQSLIVEPRTAIAAARPSGISYGTAISIMQFEHPVKAAIQARSLSALTRGRFALGLGISEPAFVRDALGLPPSSPTAFAREYVALVRDGLDSGLMDRTGDFFDVHVQLPAIDAPRAPVLLAALSPGMAKVAGETADGCIVWLTRPDYLERVVIPALEAGAAVAGRPRPRLVALVPAFGVVRRADARSLVSQTIANHASRPHYRAMLERAGLPSSTADAGDWLLDEVVAWGEAARMDDTLARYRAAGVDEIAIAGYAPRRDGPDLLRRTWTAAAQALGLGPPRVEADAEIPQHQPISIRELIATYVERVWNRGDLQFLDRCVRDEYVLRNPQTGDVVRGPTGLKRHVAALREILPDLKMTVLDIVVDGDRAAWRWQMEGTHSGGGLGLTPTGRRVRSTGMAIYRVEDGYIVERHGEADTLGLLTQLGVFHSSSSDDLNIGPGLGLPA